MFVAETPIDYDLVVRQHDAYCQTLALCGAEPKQLDVNLELPDCVFIEDTAVVLDEVAVLGSMGAASRCSEPRGIECELSRFREVHSIERPATLEGGDVLRVDRDLLVGMSSRTNRQGIAQLDSLVRHYGYRVHPVVVRECLHLKTGCTALPDGRLVVNPDWVDTSQLADYELIRVPQTEPWAANVLPVGDRVCMAAGHVQFAEIVRQLGFEVQPVEISEFVKAEGGVTCLSIVFEP